MKNFNYQHLANVALAVELTTLGAVIVFLITATVGMPAPHVA